MECTNTNSIWYKLKNSPDGKIALGALIFVTFGCAMLLPVFTTALQWSGWNWAIFGVLVIGLGELLYFKFPYELTPYEYKTSRYLITGLLKLGMIGTALGVVTITYYIYRLIVDFWESIASFIFQLSIGILIVAAALGIIAAVLGVVWFVLWLNTLKWKKPTDDELANALPPVRIGTKSVEDQPIDVPKKKRARKQ